MGCWWYYRITLYYCHHQHQKSSSFVVESSYVLEFVTLAVLMIVCFACSYGALKPKLVEKTNN
jgi:hypothetical protein